ncbi:cytochrome P450 [Aspergillus filifer]
MEPPTWASSLPKPSSLTLIITLAITILILKLFRISSARCPGIPSIPFHVSIWDAYNRVSEIGFHNARLRPLLEAHGAVNLWNSGQWAVLVTKPEYVARILRNERAVAKGGFYGKVPNSTLAGLFGENLIDSHGETWKQFTAIMKPGIQRAPCIPAIKRAARKLMDRFLGAQQAAPPNRGVVINDLVERWAIDVFGEAFFDVDFGALDGGNVRAQNALTGVLWNLGGHLIHHFPLLEQIGWPLRPIRNRCFTMIRELEESLIDITENLQYSKTHGQNRDGPEKLIYRLKRARDEGLMSDFHYRSNLKMMFFAGHENVKFAVIATLWNLLAIRISRANCLPYLTAILAETLRLYPPVSQLINRKTLEPVPLGNGITIPAGTWVGWTAYGIHTDPNTWGPTAHEFSPERWGLNSAAIHRAISQHQIRGSYIPFNAWTRSCIGSEFAMAQMRVMLVETVRRFEMTVAPGYHYSIKENASLEPYDCRLVFRERT